MTVLLADDDACSRSLSTVAPAWRPRSMDTMPAVPPARNTKSVAAQLHTERLPCLSGRQTVPDLTGSTTAVNAQAVTTRPVQICRLTHFFYQERPPSYTTSGSMNRVSLVQ